MVRVPTAHCNDLALESLFHLVTQQLDCPMAVLTKHRAHSEDPDVIATSHMAEPLARGIAGSIHQAAASRYAALPMVSGIAACGIIAFTLGQLTLGRRGRIVEAPAE